MTVAFVFPGQGGLDAEAVASWAEDPVGGDVLERVGRAAALDLTALPEDAGSRTALAQPALFAASLAAHRALRAAGVEPEVVAGHSLGELSAAVAAGALTLTDGAGLVAERGRAFANACACTPGAMAAVLRLDEDEVRALVAAVDEATVANVNAPGQLVVSGPPGAVDRIRETARDRGGRALPLGVEGAFHSPAMTPAMVRMELALRPVAVGDTATRLISGVSGRPVTAAGEVRAALIEGVLAPVEWVAVQRRLTAEGVDHLVEVGPGGVLAGLARRTLSDVTVTTVATPDDVPAAVSAAGGAPAGDPGTADARSRTAGAVR